MPILLLCHSFRNIINRSFLCYMYVAVVFLPPRVMLQIAPKSRRIISSPRDYPHGEKAVRQTGRQALQLWQSDLIYDLIEIFAKRQAMQAAPMSVAIVFLQPRATLQVQAPDFKKISTRFSQAPNARLGKEFVFKKSAPASAKRRTLASANCITHPTRDDG